MGKIRSQHDDRHRSFAELLEQGTRTTLTIPTYLPSSISAASTVVAQAADSQRSVVEMESLRTLGLNPTQALQHPGFYYFMAARCVENRRARFLAALEHGVSTYVETACVFLISVEGTE